MSILNEEYWDEIDAEFARRVYKLPLHLRTPEAEQAIWDEIVEYCLFRGNPWPLTWSIVRNRMSERLRRLIVDLFQGNTCLPVYVKVQSMRKYAQGFIFREQEAVDLLYRGIRELSEDKSPSFDSWQVMVNGFRFGHPKLYPPPLVRGRHMPPIDGRIAIKLKFREKLGHRHPDPVRPLT